VFAKNRFIRYREYIHSVNKRLDTSAAVLNEQAAQLRIHSEQLLKLRNDLEAKIAVKHLERDQKKAMLSKYAYVNAHHVRGPLARILGLIALIENDKMPRDRKRYLDEIKSDALEIDGVVRKISEVLSD
jgi:signal transduction histidine kinase